MRKNRGFTLIEAMIVVSIIAILAAIAIPSYQSYTRKGNRATAQTFMMAVATRQSQYILDARNYAVGAAALATLSLTVPPDVSKYYTVAVDPALPASPPTYTITATPLATAGQVVDGTLTLDSSGAKTRNGVSGW